MTTEGLPDNLVLDSQTLPYLLTAIGEALLQFAPRAQIESALQERMNRTLEQDHPLSQTQTKALRYAIQLLVHSLESQSPQP